jgi:hypothetical protein
LRFLNFAERSGLRLAGVEEIARACSVNYLHWQPSPSRPLAYIAVFARVATAANLISQQKTKNSEAAS